MNAVPSLAEIAADPALIVTLDPVVASALGAAFSGLAASCAFRAMQARAATIHAVQTATGDRALSLEEAAALLGLHPKTLARYARTNATFNRLRLDLGGVRRLRFSEARVMSYLQQGHTLGSQESRPDPAPRRKGIRAAQPLRPIRG